MLLFLHGRDSILKTRRKETLLSNEQLNGGSSCNIWSFESGNFSFSKGQQWGSMDLTKPLEMKDSKNCLRSVQNRCIISISSLSQYIRSLNWIPLWFPKILPQWRSSLNLAGIYLLWFMQICIVNPEARKIKNCEGWYWILLKYSKLSW